MRHRSEADQLIRTTTPRRLAHLESDVFVPALQGVLVGGAHLWGQRIRQAFHQAVVLEQPELANARGFYRFAAHLGEGG